jgi:hypothetical protein
MRWKTAGLCALALIETFCGVGADWELCIEECG